MRIALVSPYSYTYPGGVGRHVEALAEELIAQGHDARLLAPYDPDDRLARLMHRGATPERREIPDHLVPLGRTVRLSANGSASDISLMPGGIAAVGRELRTGGYDVVHVHEVNAPVASWYAAQAARVPLVATFHCYSTSRFANGVAQKIGVWQLMNRVHVKIAVSEAARWTLERFFGGRHRVIPNGVDLTAALTTPKPADDGEVRLLFIGRPDERKGLPILVRAFDALREAGVPARLTVAGATEEEIRPFVLDHEGIDIAGRVPDAEKWRLLHDADLLCAPSLGGESFGMVLTEAFASATPVVASGIAGYRDVVRDGVDGLLVPAGDPAALAEALRALALDPDRRREMSAAARERAERFAWPQVTREVVGAYEDAIALAQEAPAAAPARIAQRAGLTPADNLPRVPARRVGSIEPADPQAGRRRTRRLLRRGAISVAAVGGVGLAGLALHRIGVQEVADALLGAAPIWVLAAFALMCASLLMRAESWNAILRAAVPDATVRRADTARATMVGVIMSATLPARLGEPSRALIMARRLGRVRERLPVVLGTLVSQTLLNILALAVLGAVMIATVGLFQGNEDKLVLATLAPVALFGLVALAPVLLRSGRSARSAAVRRAVRRAGHALGEVRRGLGVFRRPRLGIWAAAAQLSAWAIQWLACYLLLVALGLDAQAGIGAAAAVLFAVNLTAVLPAIPSNIGVFQAACVAVLAAYGVAYTDALAYGIVLQAVEVATAVALGMPALLREGMTWKDMRLRALHTAPVELPVGRGRAAAAEAEA